VLYERFAILRKTDTLRSVIRIERSVAPMGETMDTKSPFGQLRLLSKNERYANIEGVQINLNHASLNPNYWRAPLLIVHPEFTSGVSDVPFIWFHWFGRFSEEQLRARAKQVVEKAGMIHSGRKRVIGDDSEREELETGIETAITAVVEIYVKQRTPECEVCEGDKIVISRVAQRSVGDFADHEHDRNIRRAYLRIIKSNGTTQNIH
jgi:hypothetical protein